MTFKDDFIKSEELKMNWFDKLTMNYPDVHSTESISRPLKNKQSDKEKIIRPSYLRRVFITCLLLLPAYVWAFLLKMLLEYTFPLLVLLLGFFMVSFIIYLMIRNSFFNKEYIYTIRISSEAISIRNNKFYWTDIAETCIMNYTGRSRNSYLLIFRKDGTIGKFALHAFSIPDSTLSEIIERYKAFYVASAS